MIGKLGTKARLPLLGAAAVAFWAISSAYAQEDYSTWQFHSRINLNTSSTGSSIAGTTTKVAVIVRLTTSNFPDYTKTLSGGADIRFSKANLAQHLSYEIERWVDGSGFGAEIWVKVDTVLGNNATQYIVMSYGKSGVTSQSSGSSVYDTADGYLGAWHLNTSGTGNRPDATILAHGAINKGAVFSSSGSVSGCDTFACANKVYDSVASGAINLTSKSLTLMAWAKITTTPPTADQYILTQGTGATDNGLHFGYRQSTAKYTFAFWGDDLDQVSAYSGGTTWHLITGTYNSSNKLQSLYIDGALDNSRTATNNFAGTGGLFIGKRFDNACYWTGKIDEIRIAKVVRTADWIKLCYENQKTTQTLVTVNTPPTASSVTASGALLHAGVKVSGTYAYGDAQNDSQGTSTYKWYNATDNTGTGAAAITGATAQNYILATSDVGKYICFEVTPVAKTGATPGATVKSGYIGPIVANAAPVAAPVTATGNALTGASLTGHYTYTDAESDTEGTSTFKWYRATDNSGSGALAISGATASGYTLTTSDAGKYVCFEVTPVAKTGTSPGAAAKSSYIGPITAANSVPVASNVTASGALLHAGKQVNGNYTYTDAEIDSEGVSICKWYSATDNSGTGATPIGTVRNYTLTTNEVGKYVCFEVTPVAKTGASPGVPVKSLYIGPIAANAPPVAANLTLTGSPSSGELLTGTFAYSDAESDTQGVSTFKWYLANDNSGTNAAPISGANSATYTPIAGNVGKFVCFEVTPVAKTGTSPGTAVRSSYSGPITPNAPPVAANVAVTGNAQIGSTLTANYSYTDPEGDPAGSAVFQWYRVDNTGVSAISGATTNTYTPTSADMGKYICFDVTPTAGSGNGTGATVRSALLGPITEEYKYPAACNAGQNMLVDGNIRGKKDIILGADGQDQKFIWRSRSNGTPKGDFMQLTYENSADSAGWAWNQGITLVRSSGTVGIATTAPDSASKLDVNGRIRCDELKIRNWLFKQKLATTPDYVFSKENGYNLLDLDSLSQFIKNNGHLPEVPSADEMQKEGLDLTQFNMLLLKKIEELTLYQIESRKKMDEMEKELKRVKSGK